jgi:hypothetical protein
MTWVKGQSGNPSGRKIEPKAEIRELAKVHTKASVETLAKALTAKDSPWPARVAAAQALLDRGWGKPTQHVEVTKSPLDELEPDELSALASAVASLPEDESRTTH